MPRMDSDSVGRLGEHYVDEITSRLGFRWRAQKEKSYAGDGIIEVFGKGSKSADFIWVEVKAGRGSLSSTSKTHYSIKVEKEHTDYWLGIAHRLAIILVWFDPVKRIAFWTQVSRETISASGTAVRIPKSSLFGLHSAGDLKNLCAKIYRPNNRFKILHATDLGSSISNNIKKNARSFYDQWRTENFIAPAYGRVIVSLSGWRHMTDASRSQAHIVRRLELISIAKLILTSIYTRTRVRWVAETKTSYYKQTAIIRYKHRADALVSVFVKEKEGHIATFHSVYEHVRGE